MSKSLPLEIAQLVEQHAPPGHKLIWLRCNLMKPPVEIERPPLKSQILMGRKLPIEHDTLLELRDVDTGEGWDARLIGVGHDIVVGDFFSVLAHLPPGEKQIRKLVFLYNHKNGVYKRIYEDVSTAGKLINELDYKRSLSFWAPSTPASQAAAFLGTLHGFYTSDLTPTGDKLRNVVLTALAGAFLTLLWFLGPGGLGVLIGEEAVLHPWLLAIVAPAAFLLMLILFGIFSLPLILLGTFLYYIVVRLIRAAFEPPRFRGAVEYSFAELIGFDNVIAWWRYARVDETYLYQEVGHRLHAHVQANPDPKVKFVVGAMRGQGTKGMLVPEEVETLRAA